MWERSTMVKKVDGGLTTITTEKNIQAASKKIKYMGMVGITFCQEPTTKATGKME